MGKSFIVRPAQKIDTPQIKRLIREGRINPTGLNWQRFLLAVSDSGEVIGCGQIKPHRDGSQELASIAVTEDWRGRGVAGEIIRQLAAQHQGPLYLMCRSELEPMYQKHGFRSLSTDEMPRYLKRISKAASIIGNCCSQDDHLLVMGRGV